MELGYTKLCATPHVYQEYYPNKRQEILEKYDFLLEELAMRNIKIEINCAAEYYLDSHFLDLLSKNKVLPIANKYLLVEDNFLERAERIESFIFAIRTHGFQPILAHPERFSHIAKDQNRLYHLRQMGCLFQLNLLSLAGYYGAEAQHFGKMLLKKNYVDFIGTDIHNTKQLAILEKVLTTNRYRKILQNLSTKNNLLFKKNTKDLIPANI